MITDFQKIAEPLIKAKFPSVSVIRRTDECRGVVHLDFVSDGTLIRVSWEPWGPPWALITNPQGGAEQIWTDPLTVDDLLVSPDMKTDMETKNLLDAIVVELTTSKA